MTDKMQAIHKEVRKNLTAAYKKYAQYYNLRSRDVGFEKGSIVFVREHPQSQAGVYYCAKFTPKFCKARIRSRIGNVNYEIETEDGKSRKI